MKGATSQKQKLQVDLSSTAKKLHVFCQEGNLAMARDILEKAPAVVNHPNDAGNSPLMVCLKFGHAYLIRLLLQAYPDALPELDLNHRNNSGQTPLHIACRNNDKESAALLLQKGADVNAQDMVRF